MKHLYLAFLFLAGLLVLAAPTEAATTEKDTGYVLTNKTIHFSDGTSIIIPVMRPAPTVTNKYPPPHWMPKPFDGTPATCKMGLIGKNWRGEPICYRPRRGR